MANELVTAWRSLWSTLLDRWNGLGRKENLLDSVATGAENYAHAAGSAIGVTTPYDQLPEPPTPEPATITSLSAMADFAQPLFSDLETDLVAAIAPLGYTLHRSETLRSQERQAWLYGIGRDYKAPGRTGIVTNIRNATDAHARGVAADYSYVPGENASDADTLHAALAGVAAMHPEMTWGGTWHSLHDAPHWELKT